MSLRTESQFESCLEQPMHMTNYPDLKARVKPLWLPLTDIPEEDRPFAVALFKCQGVLDTYTLGEAIKDDEASEEIHHYLKTGLSGCYKQTIRKYYHAYGNDGLFKRFERIFRAHPEIDWGFDGIYRDNF